MTTNVYVSYAGLTYFIQVSNADVRLAQASLTFAVQNTNTRVRLGQASAVFATQNTNQRARIGQASAVFALRRQYSGSDSPQLRVGSAFLQVVIKPQYGYGRAFFI